MITILAWMLVVPVAFFALAFWLAVFTAIALAVDGIVRRRRPVVSLRRDLAAFEREERP